MKRTAALTLGVVILAGVAGPRTAWADHHRCSNFSSQAEAQAHYRSSPFGGEHTGEGHSALDDDGDGVACEALPGPYDRVPVTGNALSAGGRSVPGSPLPRAGVGEMAKSGAAGVALAALICCAGSALALRLRRRLRAK